MAKSIKVSTKYFTNPLFLYALSFIAVLSSFSLKWSTFYSSLSQDLIIFIIISSLLSLLFARSVRIRRVNLFRVIPESRNNRKIWIFIVLSYIFEFAYCRNVPFISVILGGIGGYRDFEGIPMFHVILSNISIFWAIYVFLQYRSNRKSKELRKYVFLSFLPFIITLSRGAIIQILFGDIFILLLSIKYLTIKKILYFVSGAFIFLILFGIMGNARDENSQTDDKFILRVGGASDEFIDSSIPKSLYWGYLYTASPLGNFQEAVKLSKPNQSFESFLELIIENYTPDFISKRLITIFPEETIIDREQYYVTPVFNAPTVFFIPYIRFGWIGVYTTFLFMVIVVYSYIKFVSIKSKFFLVGWVVLDTTIVLNTFNNMWYFNGLSLLLLTVILSYSNRIFKKIRQTYLT